MSVSYNTTNDQSTLDDRLDKITRIKQDFLSQVKISDILICCARIFYLHINKLKSELSISDKLVLGQELLHIL